MQIALEPANQPEVMALIDALDAYQRRGPFGDYWDDPNSVFMDKGVVAGLADAHPPQAQPPQSARSAQSHSG